MSNFTLPTYAKATLIGLASITSATVIYAAIFDYRRRNDPVFRKKLGKQARQLQRSSDTNFAESQKELARTLMRALVVINSERSPVTVEEKEAYFMEQVALGEQLAAKSPEFYVASAICFFKALKVYPAPAELAQIYQKTQPAQVFALVMELISLEQTMEAAASRSMDPRDRADDALLTEILPEPVKPSAPASVSSDNGSGSSPSSGSYVHVEEDTPAVEVEAVIVEEVVVDAEVEVKAVEEVVDVEADPAVPSLAEE